MWAQLIKLNSTQLISAASLCAVTPASRADADDAAAEADANDAQPLPPRPSQGAQAKRRGARNERVARLRHALDASVHSTADQLLHVAIIALVLLTGTRGFKELGSELQGAPRERRPSLRRRAPSPGRSGGASPLSIYSVERWSVVGRGSGSQKVREASPGILSYFGVNEGVREWQPPKTHRI